MCVCVGGGGGGEHLAGITALYPIYSECRELLQALLCLDPQARLNTQQLIQSQWATLESVKPPAPINSPTTPKYTIENCLPVMQLLPPPKATPFSLPASNALPPALRAARPLGSRIGAYGRRLAEAVKQVGHNKTQAESHSNEEV